MAWPYANGPLHLGHVAGNCLPADIQYKYERMRGRRVLSGSDEHGWPITVTADESGSPPQFMVMRTIRLFSNSKKLMLLIQRQLIERGVEFGGAL